MLACWNEPSLQARLLREELKPVRINTFSSSEGMDGVERADPAITAILRDHIDSIASDFNSTMPLDTYVEWNAEQWNVLHGMLQCKHVMPYPYHRLLSELHDELPEELCRRQGAVAEAQTFPSPGYAAIQLLSGVVGEQERLETLMDLVNRIVCDHAAVDRMDADTGLTTAGLDSLAAVELVGQLRGATGIEDLAPAVLLSGDATVRSVAAHVLQLVDGDNNANDDMIGSDELLTLTTPMSSSVALGTAPRPPALSGKVLILLSAPCSGADWLTIVLQKDKNRFAPCELNLLPYVTMEERSLHLEADESAAAADPLLRAVGELKACSLDSAQAFLDDLGPSCPTWCVYEALIELASPRVLVDVSSTNADHINFARRAQQMFEQPCFVHLVRHPMACVAESDTRLSTPAEVENGWLQANAVIHEHVSELPASAATHCSV